MWVLGSYTCMNDVNKKIIFKHPYQIIFKKNRILVSDIKIRYKKMISIQH